VYRYRTVGRIVTRIETTQRIRLKEVRCDISTGTLVLVSVAHAKFSSCSLRPDMGINLPQ